VRCPSARCPPAQCCPTHWASCHNRSGQAPAQRPRSEPDSSPYCFSTLSLRSSLKITLGTRASGERICEPRRCPGVRRPAEKANVATRAASHAGAGCPSTTAFARARATSRGGRRARGQSDTRGATGFPRRDLAGERRPRAAGTQRGGRRAPGRSQTNVAPQPPRVGGASAKRSTSGQLASTCRTR
jgi:hypothetical protein